MNGNEQTVPMSVMEEILRQLNMLQETVNELKEMIREKDRIIEQKNQIILNLNRAKYGQRSEKTVYVMDDGSRQMCMFEETGDGVEEKPAASVENGSETAITVAAHKRKPKRTLEELCEGLPVEEVLCDIPEEEKPGLKCIGTETVRTELIKEKAKYSVKKYLRKVYADPKAEAETGEARIVKAETPAPLFPHSYASGSLVTDIIIRKYADALPLYRQEQIWKREGIELKRGTMCNWVIMASEMYLKRVSDRMKEHLLSQSVIHADETVLQVLKEPGRAPEAESRLWVYAAAKRAGRQIRIFQYENSRKGACAEESLKGFRGVLICDGYSGYNAVGDITRAGCWAHMRRKWHEAMPKDATLTNSKAAVGMDYCTKLFEAERGIEHLPDSERLEARQRICRPIVEEYYGWLDTLYHPAGKLKDAVTYGLNQKAYLMAFLEHGEIEISNNQVENAIRPAVVGRKNWLFCDTPDGAEASAVIYSVIETAKANNLNPEKYLAYLLSILPDRCARDNNPAVDDLMPWQDQVRKACGAEY